jgi:protease I
MARIAIVLGPDFEDSEFDVPRTTLQGKGHDVTVIGTSKWTKLTGKRGDVSVTIDATVDEVDPGEFEALVIPGGYSPDHLRIDDSVVRFVRDVANRGVPVAAICHAGSLLIDADLVDGRMVTSWPSIRTDLVNAGAVWVDEEVVIDGNLITSRKPDDLPAFVDAIDRALARPEVVAG